jgi:hypothetical protein
LAPRIAIETSAVDTPARAATSARVGRFPPGSGVGGIADLLIRPGEAIADHALEAPYSITF